MYVRTCCLLCHLLHFHSFLLLLNSPFVNSISFSNPNSIPLCPPQTHTHVLIHTNTHARTITHKHCHNHTHIPLNIQHTASPTSQDKTKIFPAREEGSYSRITCVALTDDFLYYGTEAGTVEVFFLGEYVLLAGIVRYSE